LINGDGNTDASCLERYRVGSIPSVFYIPNYLDEDEEQQIIDSVSTKQDNGDWLLLIA